MRAVGVTGYSPQPKLEACPHARGNPFPATTPPPEVEGARLPQLRSSLFGVVYGCQVPSVTSCQAHRQSRGLAAQVTWPAQQLDGCGWSRRRKLGVRSPPLPLGFSPGVTWQPNPAHRSTNLDHWSTTAAQAQRRGHSVAFPCCCRYRRPGALPIVRGSAEVQRMLWSLRTSMS